MRICSACRALLIALVRRKRSLGVKLTFSPRSRRVLIVFAVRCIRLVFRVSIKRSCMTSIGVSLVKSYLPGVLRMAFSSTRLSAISIDDIVFSCFCCFEQSYDRVLYEFHMLLQHTMTKR